MDARILLINFWRLAVAVQGTNTRLLDLKGPNLQAKTVVSQSLQFKEICQISDAITMLVKHLICPSWKFFQRSSKRSGNFDRYVIQLWDFALEANFASFVFHHHYTGY